jgi:outer membrane immunogenic protein
MRKRILASAISALTASLATAAEMPVKVAKAPSPSYYSWSGFYAGAQVGYGIGAVDQRAIVLATGLPTVATDSTVKGMIGGIRAGYNLQPLPALLLGLDADYSVAKLYGDVTTSTGVFSTTKIDWLATMRGRIGLTSESYLVYATAGAVRAHFNSTRAPLPESATGFATSWIAGAGVELRVSSHWSVSTEYL